MSDNVSLDRQLMLRVHLMETIAFLWGRCSGSSSRSYMSPTVKQMLFALTVRKLQYRDLEEHDRYILRAALIVYQQTISQEQKDT